MAVLKLVEWELNGYWHAADTNALGKGSSEWWRVPRAINMTLSDYIIMLVTKYKPDRIKYSQEHDVLTYGWKSQAAMRKFKNDINALARKYQIQVY